MGAAGAAGSQQIDRGRRRIGGELRAENGARWVEHGLIGAAFAMHHVRQECRRHHGGGHSPFIKARGHIKILRAGGVASDIRYAVQRDTVLGRPVVFFHRPGVVPRGKSAQLLPTAALFAGTMVTAAQEQQIFVIAKGQTLGRFIHVHTVHLRCVFQGDYIGAVLEHL
ncbi:hypothetical protein SDC9_128952 [bioreactor metagenome]|uniref:Uncharacterized protein n=1 Tax=bioreactor metagenome TaxID=1076179 RepID=A0A645CYE1_9ZZZZ